MAALQEVQKEAETPARARGWWAAVSGFCALLGLALLSIKTALARPAEPNATPKRIVPFPALPQ